MNQRWKHWEFWPTWAVYPPVVAWIALLAIRHRGFGAITAANPGFEDGGLVGESKQDLQSLLPSRWAVPSVLIHPAGPSVRLKALTALMNERAWPFPLVLKPNVGQRGAGVRKIANHDDARQYFEEFPHPVVAQPWHPGPFEAGIFYARHPDQPRGQVVSITEKVFPVVDGDGRSTLAELIDAHPRYRLQAQTFRSRLGGRISTVPLPGARVPLAEVGNHAQGTMFLDGRRLWTLALEARIDDIARQVPGFFIGRFDLRYQDEPSFMAGDDLSIIELNGVTAEPTDIYDPSRSVRSAYRAMFDQWRRVFEIGAANLRRGHLGASAFRLAQLGLSHLTDRRVFPVSS